MALILKRDPVGQNLEDYSVFEDGVIIGRIFKVPIAPPDRPWMWASGHTCDIRRAAHGYEPTCGGGDGSVRQELAEAIGPPASKEAVTGDRVPVPR